MSDGSSHLSHNPDNLYPFPFSLIMQRKVHFQPWVNFVTIPNISYYSKQEIESSWYSRKELRRYRNSFGQSVFLSSVASRGEVVSTQEARLQSEAIKSTHESAVSKRDQHMRGEKATDTYFPTSIHYQSDVFERVHCHPQEDRLVQFFQW